MRGNLNSPLLIKTKIALIDQGECYGGAEQYLLDWLKHWLKSNQWNQSFQWRHYGGESELYQKRLAALQKTFADFSAEKWSFAGRIKLTIPSLYKHLKEAGALSRSLAQWSPEMIITNTPRTHLIVLMMKLLGRQRGVFWVALVHDFSLPHWFGRWFLGKFCDQLVTVSAGAQAHLTHHWQPKKSILVVPNGFSKLPSPQVPTTIKRVMMLGRIDPHKGQALMIEAAHLLQERNPELEFHIVGSPIPSDQRTTDYEKLLHHQAQEFQLQRLRFSAENSEPLKILATADLVLILPTIPETFGRVFLEALALGKMVLAVDQPGPAEIWQSWKNFGTAQELDPATLPPLLPPHQPMDLAEALGKIADHSTEALEWAAMGPDLVREFYTLPKLESGWEAVFLPQKT